MRHYRHDRLLDTGQELLGFSQRQPQVHNITEVVGSANLQHIEAARLAITPRFDQPQNPRHP